VLLGSLVRLA